MWDKTLEGGLTDTKHILVIEDDYGIRESLHLILETMGYSVQTANNGKEGLNKLKANPLPALIILDLLMPVMDGTEFIGDLRADKDLPHIPVYVFSAVAGLLDVEGADGVLHKPGDLNSLLEIVKTYCG